MAKKVDHEERKREIAERAVRLFSKVGYDNVSLIMIAAASGVSRTVLYRYFCDKREILDAAIFSVIDRITQPCLKILTSKDDEIQKLEKACHVTAEVMFEHKEFLVAVFDFVVAQVRCGSDMSKPILQFTTNIRGTLRCLVKHGIRRGRLDKILQVERTVDTLYSLFESCAMRIVLGTETSPEGAKQRFSDAIHAIAAWR